MAVHNSATDSLSGTNEAEETSSLTGLTSVPEGEVVESSNEACNTDSNVNNSCAPEVSGACFLPQDDSNELETETSSGGDVTSETGLGLAGACGAGCATTTMNEPVGRAENSDMPELTRGASTVLEDEGDSGEASNAGVSACHTPATLSLRATSSNTTNASTNASSATLTVAAGATSLTSSDSSPSPAEGADVCGLGLLNDTLNTTMDLIKFGAGIVSSYLHWRRDGGRYSFSTPPFGDMLDPMRRRQSACSRIQPDCSRPRLRHPSTHLRHSGGGNSAHRDVACPDVSPLQVQTQSEAGGMCAATSEAQLEAGMDRHELATSRCMSCTGDSVAAQCPVCSLPDEAEGDAESDSFVESSTCPPDAETELYVASVTDSDSHQLPSYLYVSGGLKMAIAAQSDIPVSSNSDPKDRTPILSAADCDQNTASELCFGSECGNFCRDSVDHLSHGCSAELVDGPQLLESSQWVDLSEPHPVVTRSDVAENSGRILPSGLGRDNFDGLDFTQAASSELVEGLPRQLLTSVYCRENCYKCRTLFVDSESESSEPLLSTDSNTKAESSFEHLANGCTQCDLADCGSQNCTDHHSQRQSDSVNTLTVSSSDTDSFELVSDSNLENDTTTSSSTGNVPLCHNTACTSLCPPESVSSSSSQHPVADAQSNLEKGKAVAGRTSLCTGSCCCTQEGIQALLKPEGSGDFLQNELSRNDVGAGASEGNFCITSCFKPPRQFQHDPEATGGRKGRQSAKLHLLGADFSSDDSDGELHRNTSGASSKTDSAGRLHKPKLRHKKSLPGRHSSKSQSSGSSPNTSLGSASPRFDAQLFVQQVKRRLRSLSQADEHASANQDQAPAMISSPARSVLGQGSGVKAMPRLVEACVDDQGQHDTAGGQARSHINESVSEYSEMQGAMYRPPAAGDESHERAAPASGTDTNTNCHYFPPSTGPAHACFPQVSGVHQGASELAECVITDLSGMPPSFSLCPLPPVMYYCPRCHKPHASQAWQILTQSQPGPGDAAWNQTGAPAGVVREGDYQERRPRLPAPAHPYALRPGFPPIDARLYGWLIPHPVNGMPCVVHLPTPSAFTSFPPASFPPGSLPQSHITSVSAEQMMSSVPAEQVMFSASAQQAMFSASAQHVTSTMSAQQFAAMVNGTLSCTDSVLSNMTIPTTHASASMPFLNASATNQDVSLPWHEMGARPKYGASSLQSDASPLQNSSPVVPDWTRTNGNSTEPSQEHRALARGTTLMDSSWQSTVRSAGLAATAFPGDLLNWNADCGPHEWRPVRCGFSPEHRSHEETEATDWGSENATGETSGEVPQHTKEDGYDRLAGLYRELFNGEEDVNSDEELDFLAMVCDVKLSDNGVSSMDSELTDDDSNVSSAEEGASNSSQQQNAGASSATQPCPRAASLSEIPLLADETDNDSAGNIGSTMRLFLAGLEFSGRFLDHDLFRCRGEGRIDGDSPSRSPEGCSSSSRSCPRDTAGIDSDRPFCGSTNSGIYWVGFERRHNASQPPQASSTIASSVPAPTLPSTSAAVAGSTYVSSFSEAAVNGRHYGQEDCSSSSGDSEDISDENYEGDEEYECDCPTCQGVHNNPETLQPHVLHPSQLSNSGSVLTNHSALTQPAAAASLDNFSSSERVGSTGSTSGWEENTATPWHSESFQGDAQDADLPPESLGAVGGISPIQVPRVSEILHDVDWSAFLHDLRHDNHADRLQNLLSIYDDPEFSLDNGTSSSPQLHQQPMHELMESLPGDESAGFPSQNLREWIQQTLGTLGGILDAHIARLTDAEIQNMPSFPAAKSDTEETCPICLVNFQVGENLIRLPGCIHIFHDQCIRKWLNVACSCPVCRRVVSASRPPQ